MIRLARTRLRPWHHSPHVTTHTQHPAKAHSRAVHVGYDNFDLEELGPCRSWAEGRPIFKRQKAIYGNIKGSRSDISDIRQISRGQRDEWAHECLHRFTGTGLSLKFANAPSTDKDDERAVNPNGPEWSHPACLRAACKQAYRGSWRVTSEIKARKRCAEIKDDRYPVIYHSLETQAQALYLLGRVELERAPMWHGLAWYMLSIAAGLGQLDAALLLHQLEKLNPKYTLHIEQRATIAKAAKAKLDWRAMVANAEHMLTVVKGRSGRTAMTDSEVQHSVGLLVDALQLALPNPYTIIDKPDPPEGYVDVDVLENYASPYKAVLELTADAIQTGTPSEETQFFYETAAKYGALVYGDADAAWRYVYWRLATDEDLDDEWLQCATLAAEHGYEDSCFQLAKYYLEKDGWYPSLAVKVIAEMDIPEYELLKTSIDPRIDEAIVKKEKERHDMIIQRKSKELLQNRRGIDWMVAAARLQSDNPIRMYNRYSTAAGLLRQNGFMEEGREVLREAEEEIKHCLRNPEPQLEELRYVLGKWDTKCAHELITPEGVELSLGTPRHV